jgi:integrase
MAHIETRTGKTGRKLYRIIYKSPITGNRTVLTLGTCLYGTAKTRLKDVENDLALGVDPKRKVSKIPSPRLLELLELDSEKRQGRVSDRTIENTSLSVRNFVESRGNPSIDDITKKMIDDWMRDREKTLKPDSISIYFRSIKAMITRAKDKYEIDIKNNPFNNIDLPQGTGKIRERTLSRSEIDLLLKLTEPNSSFNRLLRFYLSTGCRLREALELKWDEVFLEEKIPYMYLGKELSRTKKRRMFPVTDAIMTILSSQSINARSQYVFTDWSDGRAVARRLKRLSTKHTELEGLTPHVLKHTYVTIMLENNFPIPTIGKLVGDHPTTLMKHYANMKLEHFHDVANTGILQ